ncbi:MAG: hypothetical protein NWE89_05055 [Candidatus Bathyarchaeota archaeon]|nr:hypothetical protein [Candidatus Bathyarchaeota archaeon]
MSKISLIDRLLETQHDSENPKLFEEALTEAFSTSAYKRFTRAALDSIPGPLDMLRRWFDCAREVTGNEP